MSKRKLTQQQQQRIKHKQAQKLQQASNISSGNLGEEQIGEVICHHSRTVIVQDEFSKAVTCNLRQNLEPLAVGDRVVFQIDSNSQKGIVTALVPRTSTIARADRKGQKQVLAANIDQIFIVMAVKPKTPPIQLDSYLAAAKLCEVEAKVVVNKADLLDKASAKEFAALTKQLQELGVTSVYTSTTSKDPGVNQLLPLLKDKASIFIGQSGVGKSSLINALLPEVNTRVASISEQSGLGKHTTTESMLYQLDFTDGKIIDSPGIRQFSLWPLTFAELSSATPEIANLNDQCKFRNCRHNNEPDCAILNAYKNGLISQQRFENFIQLAKTYATDY